MDSLVFEAVLLEIITYIILLVTALYLISVYKTISLEKRISSFAIESQKDKSTSLFDHISILIWNLIHDTSKLLKKSKHINNYAKYYDKYISYENKNNVTSLDYVTIKIFNGLLFFLINFIITLGSFSLYYIYSYLVSFALGFIIIDLYLDSRYNTRRKIVEEQLLKAMIIMDNSLKDDDNINNAIVSVIENSDDIIADEFKKISSDLKYGLSLEKAFKRFAKRIQLSDVNFIFNAILINSKTQSDLSDTFDDILDTLYLSVKKRKEVSLVQKFLITITKILMVLPLIIITIMFFINHSYFKIFVCNSWGIVVFIFIIGLYSMYILMIKNILKGD